MAKKKAAQAQPVITESGNMLVYSYNQDGYFVGTDFAFPDPMTPGEYLIPAQATNVPPPVFKQNERAKWNGEEWEIEAIVPPAPEPAPSQEELAAQARSDRNALLAESDWTQLPDVPFTLTEREHWRTYRQALRDVPQQEDFPTTINWPTAP